MIEQAGIAAIEAKARMGTSLMVELYEQWLAPLGFELKSPRKASLRGGHIALAHQEARRISGTLRTHQKVIVDYREPAQIRVAISPLATSFMEIYDGFDRIRQSVANQEYLSMESATTRVT